MIFPLLFAAASATTLTIPLPDGCVPVLTGNAITCPSSPSPSPTPTPTPSPGACSPLNLRLIDSAWPSAGNVINYTGQWGASDALVIRFVAPASGTAVLQLANLGPPYAMRHATLGTAPCGAPIAATLNNSQSPSVKLIVGTRPGFVTLTAGQVYYWTVTNRNPDGTNSCLQASCSMRVDFDKAS